jgi:hypothetical protein
MTGRDTSDDRSGSALLLPVSVRFVDVREAHRHLLWHRRGMVIIATLVVGTLLLQGTVAFYRLFMGFESRTDLVIFASGLVVSFTLYTIATDVVALVASTSAQKQRSTVQMQTDGVRIDDGVGHDFSWSSLEQVCFTAHAFAFDVPHASVVISLADLTSSDLRKLRRFLADYRIPSCERAHSRART